MIELSASLGEQPGSLPTEERGLMPRVHQATVRRNSLCISAVS